MMHDQIFTLARRADIGLPFEHEREKELHSRYHGTIKAQAPGKVDPNDYHIRGMLLCNSERDHYYSRFSYDALGEIAEMLPGRPVMIGHDYGSLPVGRFFAGERVFVDQGRKPKKDSYWVEGLFTVPKDSSGDAIVRRIDQGIYREVSLGWRCLGATCSCCGNHIGDRQRCEHVPGEVYDEGLCEFEFSDITQVLEGSLVYAGGQKDTQTFVPGERSATHPDDGDRHDGGSSGLWWNRLARLKNEGLPSEARARQLRSRIADVVCDRNRFDSVHDAIRWVREHDFKHRSMTASETAYRFKQFDAPHARRAVPLDDRVVGEVSTSQRSLTFDDLNKRGDT